MIFKPAREAAGSDGFLGFLQVQLRCRSAEPEGQVGEPGQATGSQARPKSIDIPLKLVHNQTVSANPTAASTRSRTTPLASRVFSSMKKLLDHREVHHGERIDSGGEARSPDLSILAERSGAPVFGLEGATSRRKGLIRLLCDRPGSCVNVTRHRAVELPRDGNRLLTCVLHIVDLSKATVWNCQPSLVFRGIAGEKDDVRSV